MTGDSGRDRAAVLFDVDGTLVDSNYLHVAAWAQAFQTVGHPVPAWRIHRAIGMDSARLLQELLGPEASALGDRAAEEHKRAYAETTPLLRPLPGARELIAFLAERGVAVVLATSAPPDELDRLRAVLKVDELLTAVTTADDVETAKPEPDLIQVAIHRSGCSPDRVVFVGDAVWDMRAAARAGVGRIGLLSGGTSEAELRAAGAEETYADAVDLLAHIFGSRLALW
ncbi:haloacid dehalogenase superfamily, subfamily IA, variant 3 with third motif having DD or ED/haloacid dehalogenase superfamily, subfamily IA, variant 1 with third motif having Dx(3-4)D or Dx(3-4)E [Frankineae bacterium MT45]|nr:haloacid dehalogenase superfamily, subfamily IA, variant 3 with third motif having DD or ED/haloacid dehalogenase superfamily, subfamily IA, variant 1 with third motif having Dx(3-4)D or Dx(3-4)E [Frankineae bacterium MT45]